MTSNPNLIWEFKFEFWFLSQFFHGHYFMVQKILVVTKKLPLYNFLYIALHVCDIPCCRCVNNMIVRTTGTLELCTLCQLHLSLSAQFCTLCVTTSVTYFAMLETWGSDLVDRFMLYIKYFTPTHFILRLSLRPRLYFQFCKNI